MSNKILTFFGFKFDKGVFKSVTGGLNEVRTSAVRASLGIDDINKSLKKMVFAQNFISMSIAAKGAAASIKSAFSGIQQAYSKIVDVAGQGDRIAKTSKMLGLTVDEYQAFTSAAKHSGMSVEEFDSSFKKFNVTLGKARLGDKDSFKKISSLLPKNVQLSSYKDVSSVIADIADGYTKLQSAEQKAFVSQELFGKSGQKISELFKNGSEGLYQAYKDFKENGGGFDEKGAENAEEFNDELQKVQESFSSLKVSVMQELFPTFIDMFKFVRSYLKENGLELKTKLVEIGKVLSSFIVDVLPKIPKWIDTILKLVDKIGVKNAATLGIVGYFIPVLARIAVFGWWLVKAVWGVVKPLLKIFGLVKVVALWIRKWFIILNFVAALKGVALGALGLVVLKISAVTAGILSWIYVFKSIYKNWDMLKSFMSDIVGDVGDWFANLGKKISDFFMDKLSGLRDFVVKINDSIFGLFRGFPGRIKSFFGVNDVDVNLNTSGAQSTLAASAAQAISESNTTVTNRFAVDFNNVPRGTKITPPPKGDFDWSRGYVLGGV